MAIFIDDIQYIKKKFAKTELFKDTSIIITGAGGFLGFYFTSFFSELIKNGCGPKSLLLLDNYILGEPEHFKKMSTDQRIKCERFDIVKDDFNKIAEAKDADYVIHMASIASPVFYRKYPIETFNANIVGLTKLLEYYKENKNLKGLLFFSSSEIYGDPDENNIPTNEEYRGLVSCTGPRACYDEGKRAGETLCRMYNEVYGLPVRVARPFNNYGPGMSIYDKRVPADFAKAIIEDRDIIIHSDGTPTRTFCYIADAIVGYLKVLTYDKYDYFNIGIEKPEITIIQLAGIYAEAGREIFDYNGEIKYEKPQEVNYLTHNPQRRCPDISKARKYLKYEPEILVDEGIRRYLQFLKEGSL